MGITDTTTRFRVTLETRTVVVSGVLKVDVSSLNAASAWAYIVEKLEELGIIVVEIPSTDSDWLRTELTALSPVSGGWKTIEVSDVPAPTAMLCWKQNTEPPNTMCRCDRKSGHRGRHSWEPVSGGTEK